MNNPKYIKLSWEEYQSLRDLVFNSHVLNNPDILDLPHWEFERVDFLVKLCEGIDATINAIKLSHERLIY